METYCKSYGRSIRFAWLLLSIFLLLGCAKAENKAYPTANVNLSPIQAWRSAQYCMQNASTDCITYKLNETGWLNVTHTDGDEFCSRGCADHIRAVLRCVHHVKKDYRFENKATVGDLYQTIDIGCDTPQGFNGTSLHSRGYRLKSVPLLNAISASAFLLIVILL